jgi:hypothetical protein
MMFENLSDPISFFRIGRFERVSFGTFGKLFIRDGRRGVVFDTVNPRVSDSVGELFLLSPEDRIGQVSLSIGGAVESFSQNVLSVKSATILTPVELLTMPKANGQAQDLNRI